MTQGRNLLDVGFGEGASMVPPSQGSSPVVQASQNAVQHSSPAGLAAGHGGERGSASGSRTWVCLEQVRQRALWPC